MNLKIGIETITKLAPTGTLRAAINLGNPILANLGVDGQPVGVSVDLAKTFAEFLGLPLQLAVFDAAGKAVEAVTQESADVGFFAVDPVRGAGISFSAPYLFIEGAYLVRDSSSLRDQADVDRLGHRVVVGNASAYDLYLRRELKLAKIMRSATSPSVVDTFIQEQAEVAAGVKQQLEADAKSIQGLRLLPGRFMVIQQAMGVPKIRGDAVSVVLLQFVEHMKSSGFILKALRHHGIEDATVAP